MSSKLKLSGDLNLTQLAKLTPGYVGADLKALVTAAGMIAVKRIFSSLVHQTSTTPTLEDPTDDPAPLTIQRFLTVHSDPLSDEELESLAINLDDFLEAVKKVQPSSKREGFATVPGVSWSDIGALSTIRQELRMAIVEPIRHRDLFTQVGISASCGVLLWGPPGCGKTLLAKAVANEAHSNFISVKGPELLNKYVGESERSIRQVFDRARASSPCVVFFDEMDALCGRRDENQSEVSARVVNTLLTELDGLESRKQVFIIAATNRPDMIDPAILRPGRLDKLLYVELPTPDERADILKTLTKKTPLSDAIDLKSIAHDDRATGFSGADLASLVRESSVVALKSALYKGPSENQSDGELKAELAQEKKVLVSMDHFNTALNKVSPSVSKQDMKLFEGLKVKFGWKY
jgi:ribosome biogenesis ATPase